VFIDNATGKLLVAGIAPIEATQGYKGHTLHDHIMAHALTAALYSDNSASSTSTPRGRSWAESQFSRAVRELELNDVDGCTNAPEFGGTLKLRRSKCKEPDRAPCSLNGNV